MRNTLKAAALASVCLAPLAAAAQDLDFDVGASQPAAPAAKPADYNNEIEAGLRYQSQTNAYFGRYSGMYNDGVDFVGGFSLRNPPNWQSNDTYYWQLTGKDLDFGAGDHYDLAPEAAVGLKVGNQGKWGLKLNYDAITYVGADWFTSIYNQNGSLNSAAAAYFANNAGNAANYTRTVNPLTTDSMAQFDQTQVIGTRRDRATADLTGLFGNWVFGIQEMHEHKQGSMVETGLENGGNNGQFAAFPLPINYDTDNVTVRADYNTRRWQTRVRYTFSNFTDNNTAFNYAPFQYSTRSTTTPSTGTFPTGYYAEAPSNMAHTINVSTGYALSPVTRLNGTFQYGAQMQNEGFVPATGAAVLAGMSGASQAQLASNPNSLDGLISTVFGKVQVTSRPTRLATVNASYTVDGRYAGMGGQWIYGDVSDNTGAPKYRYAVESSWTKQKASFDLGYRVLPNTRIGFGYDFIRADRTEAITASTTENRFTAKVRSQFTPDVVGRLLYTYTDRTASTPNYTIWTTFLQSDCASLSTLTSTYVANCQQVPFYENGVEEHTLQGRLTDVLDQDTSLSLVSKFDDAHYSSIPWVTIPTSRGTQIVTGDGLNHKFDVLVGPDVTRRFAQDMDADFFYTFQRTYRAMTADNYGAESTTGDTHTAGASMSWQVSDKLKVATSYTLSYGSEAFSQSGFASPVADTVLPVVVSMDNSFKIHGDYEVMPGITVSAGYGFDRLIASDWALWGAAPSAGGTLANGLQLTSGEMNPNFNVHTIITQVSFKW